MMTDEEKEAAFNAKIMAQGSVAVHPFKGQIIGLIFWFLEQITIGVVVIAFLAKLWQMLETGAMVKP